MATVSVSASNQGGPDKSTPSIYFDISYLKCLQGLLKVAEAVVSILGFICVQTIPLASYFSAGGWYSFVSMTGFWMSLILLVFYLFHIIERFSSIPWLIAEFLYAAIWSAFFFIAACVAAANAKRDPGWGAAAFFGFLAMCIFGFEASLKYKNWRSGKAAQGEKQTADADTNTPPPSYPTY